MLLWQENEEASVSTAAPRSRSCSISSEPDDEFAEPCPREGKVGADLTRQSRILSDMPGSNPPQPPETTSDLPSYVWALRKDASNLKGSESTSVGWSSSL
jgi:hypothetical protein